MRRSAINATHGSRCVSAIGTARDRSLSDKSVRALHLLDALIPFLHTHADTCTHACRRARTEGWEGKESTASCCAQRAVSRSRSRAFSLAAACLAISAACNTVQHAATPYNTLQHRATRCNTVQHAATRNNTLRHGAWAPASRSLRRSPAAAQWLHSTSRAWYAGQQPHRPRRRGCALYRTLAQSLRTQRATQRVDFSGQRTTGGRPGFLLSCRAPAARFYSRAYVPVEWRGPALPRAAAGHVRQHVSRRGRVGATACLRVCLRAGACACVCVCVGVCAYVYVSARVCV